MFMHYFIEISSSELFDLLKIVNINLRHSSVATHKENLGIYMNDNKNNITKYIVHITYLLLLPYNLISMHHRNIHI